jgi:hypothetical protein
MRFAMLRKLRIFAVMKLKRLMQKILVLFVTMLVASATFTQIHHHEQDGAVCIGTEHTHDAPPLPLGDDDACAFHLDAADTVGSVLHMECSAEDADVCRWLSAALLPPDEWVERLPQRCRCRVGVFGGVIRISAMRAPPLS